MPMLKVNAKVVAALQTTLLTALMVSGGLACGGGSGSGRTGTGGSTVGSGGTTGSGGAGSGTGGAGGGVGYPCAPQLAPSAAVTSFTDAVVATGRWGTAGTSFTGGVFTYMNAGGAFLSSVDPALNFHMVGNVMGYAGGGLYFDVCTSARAYTGLQFTIAGDKGTCALELQVQTNSDKLVDTQGRKGTCSTGCVYPSVKALVVTGTAAQTISVPFSSLTGGAPIPFDLHEIVGLQWQLTSPTSCTADITIDDIAWTI
jgi:hypothetical protein